MAQIIRHRKGVLESVASATKRKAELLVVTGSSVSGIDTGLLFVGTEGGTVTPANKVHTGAVTPDLTGANYDTSIDGIPFYNTTENKMYILKKGGNVEVNATANTNGTGIVSSSAQVDALGFLQVDGDSVVSGSSQITIGDTTGFSTFSGSLKASDDAQVARLANIESFTASLGGDFVDNAELAAATGALESVDAAQTVRLNQLATETGSISTAQGVQDGRLSNLEGFTSSIDTTIKTKLDLDGVISSSAQVQLGSVTGFTSYSSSADSRTSALEAAVGAGSNIDGRLSSLEVFSASAEDNDTELFASASTQQGLLDAILLSSDADKDSFAEIVALINSVDTSNDDAFAGFVTSSNAADAVQDGRLSQLEVETGSIASEQTAQDGRLDSIEGFTSSIDTTIKTKLDAETVISGSSQVQLGSVTGFTSFSSSVDSRIASLGDNLDTSIKTKLDVENVVSSSAQVIGHLVSNDIVTNGISGSSLDITGNAKIDGNLVLGGNITIGDASGDTISFGGEISSDMTPSADNTYDLGSASRRLAQIHATTFFGNVEGNVLGVINATNGVISGSAQLLNVATDFGSGRVSGDNFGDVAGTSTFTGSFVGDGSGITGLSTTITISGSDGSNDTVSLLDGALSFVGGTGVSATVATDTVTISVQDASTSVKGIASFVSDDFSVTSGAVSIKDGGVRAVNFNADVVGTGMELNGVDNTLEVSYGATAGTAVEGNTTISVSGTANEIEITGTTAQALGGGASYTIGLPDAVTIATASIQNDLSVGGNAVITGNLSVLGTTTTIDSTTVQIGDNILELNYGGAQATAGLLVTDATAPNTVSGSLLYDGTTDKWTAGVLGSEKEIARLNAAPTANTVLKADANGLLVDSVMTDDGTDATFSGDVIVTGLTASSFLYVDGSKQLTAITPSNAGDVIQWNGSSFVASNELDGGTF